jgi:hypothetical protein
MVCICLESATVQNFRSYWLITYETESKLQTSHSHIKWRVIPTSEVCKAAAMLLLMLTEVKNKNTNIGWILVRSRPYQFSLKFVHYYKIIRKGQIGTWTW